MMRRDVGISVAPGGVDRILLSVTQVRTFSGNVPLTAASGFFYRAGDRLFLVTSRHVMIDEPSDHHPDRIEIDVHGTGVDLTRCITWSLPLYVEGTAAWRQANDSGGPIDVAVLRIDEQRLPPDLSLVAFGPADLDLRGVPPMLGDPLVVVGYPLGFHDTVHHLAVARSASVASAYGVRFQQQGCFLTDAKTHRGSSGSPVVRRRPASGDDASLPGWQLLGIHSTRMDMRSRDLVEDESLGLNCAWYADVLATLTRDAAESADRREVPTP